MAGGRLNWIDALKGWGIFLVTFGHLRPWLPLETHIYSFHMCLFFFISGYLFRDSYDLPDYIMKRVKGILIPFLLWDLLATIENIGEGHSVRESLGRFLVIDGMPCWDAPIWFLLILFIVEAAYAVIMKILHAFGPFRPPERHGPKSSSAKRNSATGFSDARHSFLIKGLIIMICLLLWIMIGSRRMHLLLNLVPMAMCFYTFGDLSKALFVRKKNISVPKAAAVIAVLAAASLFFGNLHNIRISYTEGRFGNIYCCIIAAAAGTLLYFFLFYYFDILGNNKVLIYLGKNSLIIMASQYWLFKIYDIFSKKYFAVSVWHTRSTIKAFIAAVVTICIILVVVNIYKRVFKNTPVMLKVSKYFGVNI